MRTVGGRKEGRASHSIATSLIHSLNSLSEHRAGAGARDSAEVTICSTHNPASRSRPGVLGLLVTLCHAAATAASEQRNMAWIKREPSLQCAVHSLRCELRARGETSLHASAFLPPSTRAPAPAAVRVYSVKMRSTHSLRRNLELSRPRRLRQLPSSWRNQQPYSAVPVRPRPSYIAYSASRTHHPTVISQVRAVIILRRPRLPPPGSILFFPPQLPWPNSVSSSSFLPSLE